MKPIGLGAILMTLPMAAMAGAPPAPENGIISLDTSTLTAAASQEVKSVPFMIVMEGKGGKAGGVNAFRSKDGRFSAGLSKYDKLTLELKDWPVDEFMYILEGQLEIGDTKGNVRSYGPGDAFVMPKGFSGTWRQLTPIRKIAVSYEAQ
ncbi:cupin domain-containing protein [Sphingosinicella microcystinivorans]|uniref:cupin domain-containing protein n=1 Tax=Sphingosinicella microcystinivorans TaxID=335406 RepID=UPI0022F38E1A|nr:cupin domain-containing protein [Sphingosinicella microcystinivorans]WBX85215.1 cupin domain-containing protein [Sphingosinicella microcystinivorans]